MGDLFGRVSSTLLRFDLRVNEVYFVIAKIRLHKLPVAGIIACRIIHHTGLTHSGDKPGLSPAMPKSWHVVMISRVELIHEFIKNRS